MSFAIKEIGKQVYVAREQFGRPGSLMLYKEGGMPHYHPITFPTKFAALGYIEGVVKKTRTGRRHYWEVVNYV